MWRRAAIVALLAGAGGIGLWSAIGSHAQQGEGAEQQPQAPPLDIAALKQSWLALSPADFLTSAKDTISGQANDPATQKAVQQAANAEAARRLLETNVAAEAQYPLIQSLLDLARAQLTADQKTAIRAKLDQNPQAKMASELAFSEMSAKAQVMRWSGFDRSQSEGVVQAWLAGRDLTLLRSADLHWCLFELAGRSPLETQSVSVRWAGSIRAPQDGRYTFSASRTKIGLRTPTQSIETSTKVWIDDKLVLDTAAGDGRGQPVALSAGTASQIRVDFNYGRSQPRIDEIHPAIASLYWEGAGLERQLVPSSALAPPAGTGTGLQGDYKYLALNGQTVTDRRVDLQVDFLWLSGDSFIYHDNAKTDSWRRVLHELAARSTTAGYLDERLSPLKSRDFHYWRAMAEMMSSSQRAATLRAMTAHGKFLQSLSEFQMGVIYLFFRPGAEKEAVDFVGRWIQARKPPEALVTGDFYIANREFAFILADLLVFELPEGRRLLEDGYLELPDGSCSLQVAYILGYAYAFANELPLWIEKLDARLANASLTGDRRVDWLLARAQTEEFRGAAPQRLRPEFVTGHYDAGWGWLDEASLSAQTEAVGLRVFQEKIARVAANDQRWRVSQLIEEAKARFTSAESQTAIDGWKTQTEKVGKDYDAARVSAANEVQAAYVRELRRRLAEAEAANDESAIAHLRQVIQSAAPDSPGSQ